MWIKLVETLQCNKDYSKNKANAKSDFFCSWHTIFLFVLQSITIESSVPVYFGESKFTAPFSSSKSIFFYFILLLLVLPNAMSLLQKFQNT